MHVCIQNHFKNNKNGFREPQNVKLYQKMHFSYDYNPLFVLYYNILLLEVAA